MTRQVPLEADKTETLLKAVANRDRHALRPLFEVEAPRLIAIAERILRRRDLAEDAVQEAFIRIWRNASQFDPARGGARGWVATIARNAAIDMLRSARREDIVDPADIEILGAEAVSGALADLDGVTERLDENGLLRACLETLEPERRRAILMAYALGMTQGEIAGRLGAPLGTVKAWMRRSLIALRKCMT